ncbi:hypothetical protein LTR24_008659 [Lithohypha guttulata]|uniref:Uncharacterized protein n=1 Tax=Lithohypha guttulata TaxID=1690604 RepID=A0ABR0JZF0_9EURO|nr:hypothetical protein LTR24_008659 [Lithohypha guttulata]
MSPPVPSPSALRYLATCLRSRPPQAKTPIPVQQICHLSRPKSRAASCSGLRSNQQCTYTTSALHRAEDGATASQKRARIKFGKDAIQKEYQLDEDIPAQHVQLRDSEGKLLEAQSMFSLLRSINRDTEVIRALATPPGKPAVVEVTTKEILLDRLKQKQLQAASVEKVKRDSKPKQIELNWAISGNDLDMKMKQLRQFVEKGKKVEILLAAKKRQRKATPEEANTVVEEIRKTMDEIEGCKELKPLDGKIGGQALMTVGKQRG